MRLRETVKVGLIQTNLDRELCWPKDCGGRMATSQEKVATRQIASGIRSLLTNDLKPDIIVLPELTIPRYLIRHIADVACDLDCVLIAGCDYKIQVESGRTFASNEAMIVIPSQWKSASGTTSRKRRILWLGKEFPAPKEAEGLKGENCEFLGQAKLPLLDLAEYGRYGIAICYDLSDLRRAWSYRGRIDHLIVLAYNRDITSFKGFADAFSRSIYCGVAICNTGFYGGSYCVLPFQDAHRRVLYSRDGSELLSAQTIELPLRKWREMRRGIRQSTYIEGRDKDIFKPSMAGYEYKPLKD